MSRRQSKDHDDPVVVAIERVLEAERAADLKLRDCKSQGQSRVTAAREQAAVIVRRADARISRVHRSYLQQVERDVATLAAPVPADTGDSHSSESALIDAAARLAAKLTGDPGESPR